MIQIDSVLLIKSRGRIIYKNLSPKQLASYERNPDCFRDPQAALRQLGIGDDELKTLRDSILRGLDPDTSTIHIARKSQIADSAGRFILRAKCGLTGTPLEETDEGLNCTPCRQLAASTQGK